MTLRLSCRGSSESLTPTIGFKMLSGMISITVCIIGSIFTIFVPPPVKCVDFFVLHSLFSPFAFKPLLNTTNCFVLRGCVFCALNVVVKLSHILFCFSIDAVSYRLLSRAAISPIALTISKKVAFFLLGKIFRTLGHFQVKSKISVSRS